MKACIVSQSSPENPTVIKWGVRHGNRLIWVTDTSQSDFEDWKNFCCGLVEALNIPEALASTREEPQALPPTQHGPHPLCRQTMGVAPSLS